MLRMTAGALFPESFPAMGWYWFPFHDSKAGMNSSGRPGSDQADKCLKGCHGPGTRNRGAKGDS